jgi:phytoene dehydrogenase-like protein
VPDATFDAVIVGAGHNGLCLAAYLARAGLSVGVFERRHDEGGGAHTESDVTVPGFYHNLHAQYMEFIDYMPMYEDFELEKHGARMIRPEVQIGITFADGRPPLIIYLPEHMDQTYASIARYSKHDAETWKEIKGKVTHYDKLFAGFLYGPAADPARGDDVAGGEQRARDFWDLLGLPATYMYKCPKVIIDELFETPELRALLYRQCVEWGSNLHAGTGWGFVYSVVWFCGIHHLSVGGTHTLAHAMANVSLREGVTLRFTSPVVKINISDGHATGVTLKDGSKIEARRLVASNADPRTTFVDLVGEERLSPMRQERLAGWRFGPEHVLATPSFALHEAPDYKSAKHDPAINKCFYTIVGFETDTQVSEYILEAYGGAVPKRPGAGTWVNSLWDPTQAPAGKHAMNGWFFFPNASCLTEKEWDEVRATYNDRFLELWGQYAPNMTKDNVIAHSLYVPFDIEKKIGMPEGDFSHGRPGHIEIGRARRNWYRTEIDGLYLCDASVGGGGISAAGGYNCFKVICEDYELPKVWQKPTRFY